MFFKSIILVTLLSVATVFSQDVTPQKQVRPQGPQIVQCEKMQSLMKQIREHRATCDVCKVNAPFAGKFVADMRRGNGPRARMGMRGFGPRNGQGNRFGQMNGRGPRGPMNMQRGNGFRGGRGPAMIGRGFGGPRNGQRDQRDQRGPVNIETK